MKLSIPPGPSVRSVRLIWSTQCGIQLTFRSEDVALVITVRFAAQLLPGFDEIVDSARAQRQVGAVDLVHAMRNPTNHQGLGAGVPERARDLEIPGVNRIQRSE